METAAVLRNVVVYRIWQHMSGLKTTVYLDESEYQRLKAIARQGGRAPAECVREAVHEYVTRRSKADPPRSLGAGRSGSGTLSERAEDLLKGMGSRRGRR